MAIPVYPNLPPIESVQYLVQALVDALRKKPINTALAARHAWWVQGYVQGNLLGDGETPKPVGGPSQKERLLELLVIAFGSLEHVKVE